MTDPQQEYLNEVWRKREEREIFFRRLNTMQASLEAVGNFYKYNKTKTEMENQTTPTQHPSALAASNASENKQTLDYYRRSTLREKSMEMALQMRVVINNNQPLVSSSVIAEAEKIYQYLIKE